MSSDIDSLKLQLNSALRRKHNNDKLESQLRFTQRNLTEEISVVTNEISLLTEQLEVLTSCISEVKIKIARAEIGKVSEQCKMKEQVECLNRHTESFEDLFAKEQTLQVEELKVKEAEAEEQKAIISAVEEEIESIEGECAILKKRNNAMMLKMRRQLLKTRQALITNNNVHKS